MVHFVLAHFPIAMILTGAPLLLVTVIFRRDGAGRSAAVVMMAAGALLALPTVGAGLWIAGAHEANHPETLDTHRLLGIATTATALLGVLSHLLRHRIANADLIRNLLFPAAAVLVGATGYIGAEMSHGGQHAESAVHAYGASGDAHDGDNAHNAHDADGDQSSHGETTAADENGKTTANARDQGARNHSGHSH